MAPVAQFQETDLRSCNGNCEELKTQIIKGGNLLKMVSSQRRYEITDKILLRTPYKLLVALLMRTLKQKETSQIFGIYDPLFLYLPITFKERILVSELWYQKMDGDSVISAENQNAYSCLSKHLILLDLNISQMFCG